MNKMTERNLKEITTDSFKIELNMPSEYPPIKAAPSAKGGVRDRFFAAKAELDDEITVIRPFNTDGFPESNKNTLFVSPDGSDSDEGTEALPLKSLHEALRRVNGLGGAKIILKGGKYEFTAPALITKEHSGKEKSPLIITTAKNEAPEISASYKIPASAFVPISDKKRISRLSPNVRDKVLTVDLKQLGITEYGTIGEFSPALLLNNCPQTIARYPNEGETPIYMSDKIYETGGVVYKTSTIYNRDHHKNCPWEIGISDDRCLEWEWNDDIYIYGSLYAEWSNTYARVAAIDREKKSLKGAAPFDWGVQYEQENKYYFLNVFEEIDVPGEWYIDRKEGKLYFYPPNGQLTDNDDIRLASNPCNLIEAHGAENVIIDGLNLGRCCGCAVVAEDCRQLLVQRCHITATLSSSESGAGVNISGGFRSGIISSRFDYFQSRAVKINGGNRAELIPANNFVQNCTLTKPFNRFGIDISGMANIISHNYLLDTTIIDGGSNESITEYNVIEGGDTTTHDSGMIYVSGGGLSSCGNHYRYNYLFDFNKAGYGIYFDDLSRGMYAYGNIVRGNGMDTKDPKFGPWGSGERSYNHHNGGEHVFYNNISIDAGYFAFGGDWSYYEDGKGMSAIWDLIADSMVSAAVDKRTEKYMGRNPTYKEFVDALDKYYEDKDKEGYVRGEAEERLRSPAYNNYENNVIVRAGMPFRLGPGEKTATSIDTNYITDSDPGFYSLEGKDYRINKNSPIFDKIPDFVPPPFEKMGPCDDFS